MEGTTASAATQSATQSPTQAKQNNSTQTAAPKQSGSTSQTQAPKAGSQNSVFETTKPQYSETKAPEQHADSQTSTDDWSDEDTQHFTRLLSKKSKTDAAFRLRHKGEEKALESLDDLKAAILDAQRGRGANKIVEEAKKEREAVAQQKQQMEAIQQAFASGDPELAEAALQLLVGDRAHDLAQAVAERRKQKAEEYAGMSDRERALAERNKALESEFQRLQTQEAQAKEEAIEKQKQAQIREVSAQAKTKTQELVTALGLSEDAMAVYGPHVVSVLREARELGQELGTDISFDQVKEVAVQRARMASVETLQGLPPKTVYDMLGKKLVEGLQREYLTRHGRASKQQSMVEAKQQPEKQEETGPRVGTREWLRSI